MTNRLENLLGQVMLWSLLVAAAFVMVGGVLFLMGHGLDPISLTRFHAQPKSLDSIIGIMLNLDWHNPRSIIQMGILILVLSQFARVLFSGLIFLRQKDYLFVGFSIFILLVLIATCIWKF